jgi:hypothetical protein
MAKLRVKISWIYFLRQSFASRCKLCYAQQILNGQLFGHFTRKFWRENSRIILNANYWISEIMSVGIWALLPCLVRSSSNRATLVLVLSKLARNTMPRLVVWHHVTVVLVIYCLLTHAKVNKGITEGGAMPNSTRRGSERQSRNS